MLHRSHCYLCKWALKRSFFFFGGGVEEGGLKGVWAPSISEDYIRAEGDFHKELFS